MHVPLGTNPSEIAKYLPRSSDSKGEVFSVAGKRLGDYEVWASSKTNSDIFSGTIRFTDLGSTSADVQELTYENGKLIKRDYGFLPG